MWPFKKQTYIIKEKKSYPFYKIVESVSGKFWVERRDLIPYVGIAYLPCITSFKDRESAQKYIDDRTPKDNQ